MYIDHFELLHEILAAPDPKTIHSKKFYKALTQLRTAQQEILSQTKSWIELFPLLNLLQHKREYLDFPNDLFIRSADDKNKCQDKDAAQTRVLTYLLQYAQALFDHAILDLQHDKQRVVQLASCEAADQLIVFFKTHPSLALSATIIAAQERYLLIKMDSKKSIGYFYGDTLLAWVKKAVDIVLHLSKTEVSDLFSSAKKTERAHISPHLYFYLTMTIEGIKQTAAIHGTQALNCNKLCQTSHDKSSTLKPPTASARSLATSSRTPWDGLSV